MSSEDASSKGSKQDANVSIEMVTLEAQRSRTTESSKTIVSPTFGEGEINYEKTGWKLAAFLMMKTQVGIGALSIPGAFETLGLIPGVFVLLIVASMTTWSNHVAGNFCLKHDKVFSLDQAGKEMFGAPGEFIFLACLMLYYIFTAGSALVSVSTCLNALSEHGACTAAFIAVAAIVAFCLASVPKIAQISWFAPMAMMFILSSREYILRRDRKELRSDMASVHGIHRGIFAAPSCRTPDRPMVVRLQVIRQPIVS
ncbi:hypothetical protein AC578_9987 [Pseudocercospora eumusae]|uniref:Amino acid transporter transmembrane domain-containing protein n=1 Tax=Pseudocercospora eumusae TaxID=321146 RepID=A0A139HM87_9PEZI|nr:hypothetical protein AC578_9987 [Pseudocercospora eumusae]